VNASILPSHGSALPAAALGWSEHGCEHLTDELRAKHHACRWNWIILRLSLQHFLADGQFHQLHPSHQMDHVALEDPDLKCQTGGEVARRSARRKLCQEKGAILGIQQVIL